MSAAINDQGGRAVIDPVFGLPYEPCRHWHDEGFVGGCEDCHRDEYVTEILRLRAVIRSAADELLADHGPEWTTEKAKAAGKEPWCCRICGAADGGWPCLVHEIATDDLVAALDQSESRIVEDGFGSQWLKCGPGCTLHVVRPGKVQCECDSPDNGHAIAPGPSDENGSQRDAG